MFYSVILSKEILYTIISKVTASSYLRNVEKDDSTSDLVHAGMLVQDARSRRNQSNNEKLLIVQHCSHC